jgi:hypothetical protein
MPLENSEDPVTPVLELSEVPKVSVWEWVPDVRTCVCV